MNCRVTGRSCSIAALGGAQAKAKEILEAGGFKAVNGGGYKTILKILEAK